MKALRLKAPKQLELIEMDNPILGSNQVLIKLVSTGICGSDVHLYLGHRTVNYPIVIGHESWGYIDQIGENVHDRTIGQRVVIEPNIPCNHCKFCKSGRGNICPNKKVIGVTQDGCFATHLVVDSSYTWPIPESMHDQDAVTIEPLAVVVHALKQIEGKTNKKIAIIGLGAIGLLLMQLAIIEGHEVFVKDPNDAKQAVALSMGAKLLPNDEVSLKQYLLDQEVEAIFDCAGHHEALNQIFRVVPRGAIVVMIGITSEPVQMIPLQIAREGVQILPSIIYDHPLDFQKAIDLINMNMIHPGWIVDSVHEMSEFRRAFDNASSGNFKKVVLHW